MPLSRSTARALFVRSARLLPLAAALLTACGSGPSADTIERDVFVDTYVDLRIAALETDSGTIAAGDRDAILQRHGVTEDQLLTFADVHAEELEFMRDVWTDVEARLDSTSQTAAGGGS